MEVFINIEGYEGFSSVSYEWGGSTFSLADSDVGVVYHCDVLGNHEAVQRQQVLCLVSQAWWNKSRVLRAV